MSTIDDMELQPPQISHDDRDALAQAKHELLAERIGDGCDGPVDQRVNTMIPATLTMARARRIRRIL